jgi:hypothetical protein
VRTGRCDALAGEASERAGQVHGRESGSPIDTVGLRCFQVAPEHRSTMTSRVAYHRPGHGLSPCRIDHEDLASGTAMPREEFLYDFKRRLRAARKRAVLGRREPGHTSSPHPPARRSTAPPGTPGHLPSQSGHGEEEKGGESWIGLALRAPCPGTLRPNATGRSPLPGRGPSTRPVHGRGHGKKLVRPTAHIIYFEELFSSATLDGGRSGCSRVQRSPFHRGRPSGTTEQRRSRPVVRRARFSGLPASRSSPLPRASPSALRAGSTCAVDPARRARGYATGADWVPWSLRTGDEGLNPLTTR